MTGDIYQFSDSASESVDSIEKAIDNGNKSTESITESAEEVRESTEGVEEDADAFLEGVVKHSFMLHQYIPFCFILYYYTSANQK